MDVMRHGRQFGIEFHYKRVLSRVRGAVIVSVRSQMTFTGSKSGLINGFINHSAIVASPD